MEEIRAQRHRHTTQMLIGTTRLPVAGSSPFIFDCRDRTANATSVAAHAFGIGSIGPALHSSV